MQRYENAFIRLTAQAAGVSEDDIKPLVKVPEPDRGDFTMPCFPLAKKLRKNPAAIAGELASKIGQDPMFEKFEAVGPYINATINSRHLIDTVLPQIREMGEDFGKSDEFKGHCVTIDYSSPNIAKPLGFHHLRSTMIGNALARIHSALGYKVEGINFLGDWGKTFGLLAEAFVRFGDREKLEEGGISYLLELYVKANEAAAEDESFDEAARAMFRSQEAGEEKAVEMWKMFREISLTEFQRIYKRLGVSFEHIEGESFYRDGMEKVVEQVEKTVGTREDQGALVVDMEYAEGEPPMMLKKSDGATLYATRDIAAAIDRWNRFEFDKSLYVVGVEQKRHFDQLKRAIGAMGHDWADRMAHIHFGRVKGMSSRKGTVVFLEEVLDEAKDRALKKMQEVKGDREFENIEQIAEQVGIGGVVFGDMKNLRTSDYTFDWEEILNPKGFTGICCQYAHARCSSMLRKAGGAPTASEVDLSLLKADEEVVLLKDLARIPKAIKTAADKIEPSLLARAIYDVARSWNRYQQAGGLDRNLRVLCEDEPTKKARLALVDAVRIGLKSSLALLGVSVPDAM